MKSKKVLIIVIGAIIVVLLVVYLGFRFKKQDSLRPRVDEISRKLPTNAGTTRLNLPVSLSTVQVTKDKGLGGLGIDTENAASKDYVIIDVPKDTVVNSMAAGTIKKITETADKNFDVVCDYTGGIYGRYQKLADLQVKEGDQIREGQAIGKTKATGTQSSAGGVLFSLADSNRTNGVKSSFSDGVIVAPLDYLKPDVKMFLLEKYNK